MLVDVSSAQTHPIDWAKVKESGIEGVFVKATEGDYYVNEFLDEDLKGCATAGLPVVCYHFVGTYNGVFGAGDAVNEAEFFLRHAGVKARVLDIETSKDLSWAKRFLHVLNLPADHQMLYGSYEVVPNQHNALAWVADYGVKPPVPMACWQYTDKGAVPGIANAVDLSVWLGTPAQFYALFDVPVLPNPPTPPFKPFGYGTYDNRVVTLKVHFGIGLGLTPKLYGWRVLAAVRKFKKPRLSLWPVNGIVTLEVWTAMGLKW